MLNVSDAVLMTFRSIKWDDIPATRTIQQKYIFFNVEPPHFTFKLDELSKPEKKDFFNLTFTYRRDSDAQVPYFHYEELPRPLTDIEWETVSA
jgi:hypothetical protein